MRIKYLSDLRWPPHLLDKSGLGNPLHTEALALTQCHLVRAAADRKICGRASLRLPDLHILVSALRDSALPYGIAQQIRAAHASEGLVLRLKDIHDNLQQGQGQDQPGSQSQANSSKRLIDAEDEISIAMESVSLHDPSEQQHHDENQSFDPNDSDQN